MANAPSAGYWLIALNLQREAGLRPLVDEIDEAVTSWGQKNPGQRIEDNLYEFLLMAELPFLMSTIQETLRYTTSILPIRRVTEPVEFGGYRFEIDDEILCMTRCVHLDEGIHENALEYDPRRYMKQKQFRKNGEIVPNHLMPWGGGVSMCGGRSVYPLISIVVRSSFDRAQLSRHFAMRELKTFVVLLLIRYTLEIDPNSAERPSFKEERMGTGVMHPRGDLRVILRARN